MGDTSLDYRARLVAKLRDQQRGDSSWCVVSLEEFFVGNSDCGSIGPNMDGPLGPQAFYSVLKSIRERESVQDILVGISEVVDDPRSWPFAYRVHVITSASVNSVREWLSPLQPDEIVGGWGGYEPGTLPQIESGSGVYTALWD